MMSYTINHIYYTMCTYGPIRTRRKQVTSSPGLRQLKPIGPQSVLGILEELPDWREPLLGAAAGLPGSVGFGGGPAKGVIGLL